MQKPPEQANPEVEPAHNPVNPEEPRQKMTLIWVVVIFTLACGGLVALKWIWPRFVDPLALTLLTLAALSWIFVYVVRLPSNISLGFKNRLEAVCNELESTKPGETQRVASVFLKATLPFYEDIRTQARRSFDSALLGAVLGVGFFIYALYAAMQQSAPTVKISIVAGALIQVIAGLNFYLYGQVSKQFFAFHACLERIDRFMIANSLCEHLGSTEKDEMRSELVRMIAGAPLLTFDLISGRSRSATTD